MRKPANRAPGLDEDSFSRARDVVDQRIVLAHFVASLAFLVPAMVAGFLFSLQFLQAYLLPSAEFWSPGRWRMVHTNCIIYGFLVNGFLGAFHWIVPCVSRQRVLSAKLSWSVFVGWQLIVGGVAVGLILGQAQAVPWGEMPRWLEPAAGLALALTAINFLSPILHRKESAYAGLSYFLAATAWTVLVYAMGMLAPTYNGFPATSATIVSQITRDVVGLFVTPLSWVLIYYFVPAILKTPIWSHRLSRVGFLGFAFFYPFTSIDHFLYSPLPQTLQIGVNAATFATHLAALTVVINIMATVRHRVHAVRASIALRWLLVGTLFYLVATAQALLAEIPPLRSCIRFTDWDIAHSHLLLFGVLGFWLFGAMLHLLPRLLGATEWWRPRLNIWHFWLSGISLLAMFLDLLAVGLIQGSMWRDLSPWASMIEASKPYWLLRTICGIVVMVGQFPFVWNILMTVVQKGPEDVAD